MDNKFFSEIDEDIISDIEIEKNKPKDLFYHLNNITQNEFNPNYFTSELDKKNFNIYMINRYLSMNENWLQIINYIQPYNLNNMPIEIAYRLYAILIPKNKIFLKYIKGKSNIDINLELIDIFVKYYDISKEQAKEYIKLLILINKKDDIIDICKMYGLDDKKIKKIIKFEEI